MPPAKDMPNILRGPGKFWCTSPLQRGWNFVLKAHNRRGLRSHLGGSQRHVSCHRPSQGGPPRSGSLYHWGLTGPWTGNGSFFHQSWSIAHSSRCSLQPHDLGPRHPDNSRVRRPLGPSIPSNPNGCYQPRQRSRRRRRSRKGFWEAPSPHQQRWHPRAIRPDRRLGTSRVDASHRREPERALPRHACLPPSAAEIKWCEIHHQRHERRRPSRRAEPERIPDLQERPAETKHPHRRRVRLAGGRDIRHPPGKQSHGYHGRPGRHLPASQTRCVSDTSCTSKRSS